MTGPLIELKGVERHYVQGQRKLTVLSGADFVLGKGEMVALVAPSGAGKSTLLHLAGLLERPDAGRPALRRRGSGPADVPRQPDPHLLRHRADPAHHARAAVALPAVGWPVLDVGRRARPERVVRFGLDRTARRLRARRPHLGRVRRLRSDVYEHRRRRASLGTEWGPSGAGRIPADTVPVRRTVSVRKPPTMPVLFVVAVHCVSFPDTLRGYRSLAGRGS